MRTIVNATEDVPAAIRVQAKDGNGTWQDISHRILSFSFDDSIDYDSPHVSFVVDNTYAKWVAGTNQSLDPADTSSSYFVNDQPLLGCKHEIKVDISKDGGTTWAEIFRGYVGPGGVRSSVSTLGNDTITVDAVGLDYNLKSYYFTEDLVYEDASATAIADQILIDHGFNYSITVIDEPGYLITYYRTRDTNLWDAIKKMFADIGYIFRVKWHNDAFKFCVYDPLRTDSITSPGLTINGDFRVRRLSVNEEDVRTKVIVEYRDRNTGEISYEEASDDTARLKYGAHDGSGGRKHIIMRYSTKDRSLIDTAGEAANLASYILHDLKAPTPDVEVELAFVLPSVEPHDVVRFVGRDYVVDLGVTGISWEFSGDNHIGKTTIQGTAERVIGYAGVWLENDSRSPDAKELYNQNTVLGDGRNPDKPTNLQLYADTTQDVSGKTVPIVYATWSPVGNWDLDHYEVWTRLRDEDGTVIQDWKMHGVTRREAYEFHGLPAGKTLDVRVYAVDWEWNPQESS